MELLSPIIFKQMVLCSKDKLESIGKTVEKYLGKEYSDKFYRACELDDYRQANEILDATVFLLSGERNIASALIYFADKFEKKIPKLVIDIQNAYTEKKMVEVIAEYADQIIMLIEGE